MSMHGHQSRRFGIPLIPANQYAEASDGRRDGGKAQVAGREIELFVIGRVIGDVHLAILPCDSAVPLQHDGRIVVKPGSALLEEGEHQHDAGFAGDGAEEIGTRSRDGLCPVEHLHVFRLAEIKPVVQFLEYDQFGTASGGFADLRCQPLPVRADVRRVGLLNECYFHSSLLWN